MARVERSAQWEIKMVQSRSATIAVLMVATLFHTACGARRHIPIDTRTEIRQLERAIHAEVNQVRSGMGLSNVRYDRNLAQIAREHSKDMARKQYFDHVSPTGKPFRIDTKRADIDVRCPSTPNPTHWAPKTYLWDIAPPLLSNTRMVGEKKSNTSQSKKRPNKSFKVG